MFGRGGLSCRSRSGRSDQLIQGRWAASERVKRSAESGSRRMRIFLTKRRKRLASAGRVGSGGKCTSRWRSRKVVWTATRVSYCSAILDLCRR
ncbi:unnamed protein product [Linum trigynum]|uniref:Uncharacterized protein n=1 Tax=Linum trigynum TaxID=586398 RepID=A0AAV2G0K6_9ROSI